MLVRSRKLMIQFDGRVEPENTGRLERLIFTNNVDTRTYFGDNHGLRWKSENFCPAEASQVVCDVNDGPKTDW